MHIIWYYQNFTIITKSQHNEMFQGISTDLCNSEYQMYQVTYLPIFEIVSFSGIPCSRPGVGATNAILG